MRAIVVGGSGHIGELLVAELQGAGHSVVATFATTPLPGGIRYDIGSDRPEMVFPSLNSGDVVYLLAAVSHPDAVLLDPARAMRVNVIGAIDLLNFVYKRGARAVFVSSVEVFDGEKFRYNEMDVANPLNVYGLTKWRIEDYMSRNLPADRFTIIRTCWNIGPTLGSRCVVRLTYEALLLPEARMATDNSFSVISSIDTARIMAQVGTLNPGPPQVIHLAGDTEVIRSELARRILDVSQRSAQMAFSDTTFSQLVFREPRGRMTVLDNSLSKSAVGATYADSWNVIDEKIRLLDGSK